MALNSSGRTDQSLYAVNASGVGRTKPIVCTVSSGKWHRCEPSESRNL